MESKNFNKALDLLNKKLKINNMFLEIICVGGFVLDYNNIRSTYDINGFYKSDEKLECLIKEVGDELKINHDGEIWLNNSVANLNDPPSKKICKINNTFSNITLYIPPLEYILGMKLKSMRDQDVEDIGLIIKKLKIKSPDMLEKTLMQYDFVNIDIAILLEAFSYAYGMDWLENYIRNNYVIDKEHPRN